MVCVPGDGRNGGDVFVSLGTLNKRAERLCAAETSWWCWRTRDRNVVR
jgi:hypothetical protein